MSRKQKDFDPKRNHIFAAAIDELRRREGKKLSQKEIAERMGVTEDTVSRIMRLHNQVTEDIITRLQTASGCIFNLQWLRGESDVMLAIDVDKKSAPTAENQHQSTLIDQSSLMNATIAAQQTSIESLKRELVDKEESANKAEASAKRELAAKEETIIALRGQLKEKDATIAAKNAQLNEKDERLADKQAIIVKLEEQVAELKHRLSAYQSKEILGNYPFKMGAADDGEKPSAGK